MYDDSDGDEVKARLCGSLVSIYAVALRSYERPPAASRHIPRNTNDGRNDYRNLKMLLILVEMDSARLRALCPAS